MGDLTAYKMKGTDKIILRRIGGPSKDTINNSPGYALNRLHCQEFGAGVMLGKNIRFMLGGVSLRGELQHHRQNQQLA